MGHQMTLVSPAGTDSQATKPQTDSRYVVEALARALSVLGSVAEKGYDVSLAEVVKELDLPKATAYRYLQTLVSSGYLEQRIDGNTYNVGPQFLTVARTAEVLDRLRRAARPEIVRLAERFGRTANLGILSDSGVVYLDMVETRRHPDVKARVGAHDSLHATALGKAILAHLPEEEREARIRRPLREQTIKTITDQARLRGELDAVKARGYATDREENEDGAMCVGAPILCGPGYPVAAMSLTMLIRTRAILPMEEVVQELLKATTAVSIMLDRSAMMAYAAWRGDSAVLADVPKGSASEAPVVLPYS